MSTKPELVVVDNFLDNPDEIRELALQQSYEKMGSAGKRSTARFHNRIDSNTFGRLLSIDIKGRSWDHHNINGRFQFCTAEDPVVFHSDEQSYAGIIFLSPNAPVESGVTLVKSRVTGARLPSSDPDVMSATYDGNLLDPTKWETVDKIGNIYNRLVLWNGQLIHSASCYFGTTLENARLFWMFFFDAI